MHVGMLAYWHVGLLASGKDSNWCWRKRLCQISWRWNSCSRPFHQSWKPFHFPEVKWSWSRTTACQFRTAVCLSMSVLRPEQSRSLLANHLVIPFMCSKWSNGNGNGIANCAVILKINLRVYSEGRWLTYKNRLQN